MTYETITTETHGAVTLITLNRPKALNALNAQILDELIQAFEAYQNDDGQRCAVLTGSGSDCTMSFVIVFFLSASSRR